MTDNPGFLEAIFAAPDDDLPRLIYADWLEDHGQTQRAAFIRAQVVEDRYWVPDPHGSPIRGRVHTLLVPEVRPFVLDPRLAGGAGQNPENEDGESPLIFHYFRRGFIESVEVLGLPALGWLGRQGDLLFRSHPVLFIRLLRPPQARWASLGAASLTPLLSLHAIGRLRGLDVREYPSSPGLAGALVTSALTPHTCLTVHQHGLGESGRRALEARFGDSVEFEFQPFLDDPGEEIPF